MLLNLWSCYFILSYPRIWQAETDSPKHFFTRNLCFVPSIFILLLFLLINSGLLCGEESCYMLDFFINKLWATMWRRILLHRSLKLFHTHVMRTLIHGEIPSGSLITKSALRMCWGYVQGVILQRRIHWLVRPSDSDLVTQMKKHLI
jgi:hypothetical protein